jgi:hypothetical protein
MKEQTQLFGSLPEWVAVNEAGAEGAPRVLMAERNQIELRADGNHHRLSDFRWARLDVLDDWLTHSVAVLTEQGLVKLERGAQDGMRVRASAGPAWFRRRSTMERCLQEARAQVQALKGEIEADPDASNRRQRAARERAAEERQTRAKNSTKSAVSPGLRAPIARRG